MSGSPRRLKVESSVAAVGLVLLIVTLVWSDWVEIVFGVDPDHGNGLVEWSIVGVAALCTVTCSTLVGVGWRAARPPL